MCNQLLRDSDTMSMANSLELRVPFLDHNLVNHVNGIPGSLKHNKVLLIDSMKHLLPSEVYDRPKKGFTFRLKNGLENCCQMCVIYFYSKRYFDKKQINKLR